LRSYNKTGVMNPAMIGVYEDWTRTLPRHVAMRVGMDADAVFYMLLNACAKYLDPIMYRENRDTGIKKIHAAFRGQLANQWDILFAHASDTHIPETTQRIVATAMYRAGYLPPHLCRIMGYVVDQPVANKRRARR